MGAVVVETFRDAALAVATARTGATPFAFERAVDGRFVACLCESSGGGGEGVAASGEAAREAAGACAAGSIARGLAAARLEACSGMVVLVVDGANVEAGWFGSLEALVLRRGEVLHRTAPRAFWGASPGADRAGPWPVEPGDLVLLCSATILARLSEGDVSALANREELATIVRGLVTTTSTRGDFLELFAAAIRIA